MNKKNSLIVLGILLAVLILPVVAKQVSKRHITRFGKNVSVKHPPEERLIKFRNKKKKKKKAIIAFPAQHLQQQAALKPVRKPRIVIFSSIGGGGHTAVSKGLVGYLKKEYEVTIVNVFTELFTSVDTLGTVTFGKICSEDFYNFCLRCRWTNLVGNFVSVGGSYITFRQSTLEKTLTDYFSNEKPDLLISVMPMVNAAILKVAEQLDIPFLVITNDLDTTNYVINICAPKYPKFRYTLAFDDPPMYEKIKQAQFSEEQVMITGFPLRPEFFKPKDIKAVKKDFGVPKGKPVVMVFMGGAGSMASYRYVRTLAKMQLPMHILVCLGRNERLRRNIQKILLPDYVTMTIIGFTDRIADLMAISDVLITKPGPGSVCEALESNVPMILDQTSGTLWWEDMNITFMVRHGFAESLTNFNDLSALFPKYITDKSFVQSIKQKMKEFKRERFNTSIKPLIRHMLELKNLPKAAPNNMNAVIMQSPQGK